MYDFSESAWVGMAERGLNSRTPDSYFKVVCAILC